jgi:prepilin-type processing-associated H-X9-DG protein
MASPISPLEAIGILQKALKLYKQISEDVPEQMQRIARRMSRLETYLVGLDDLLNPKKNAGGLAALKPLLVSQLNEIIKDTEADASKIYDIIFRWKNNIGPGGVIFRFDWVAHTVFVLRSSPDKLDSLADHLDNHLDDINRFLLLLNTAGQNTLLLNPSQGQGKARTRSPSPNSRKEINILFVDGHNEGRSRVAEAYAKLLREWTASKKGNWKVQWIHSAGISVLSRSQVSEQLKKLKVEPSEGKKPPNELAVASLFENQLFNYSFKSTIKTETMSKTSRGLQKDMFSKYHFILVFTRGQQLQLFRLRELLAQQQGYAAVKAKGKGNIVLLGADYHKRIEDIFEPKSERGQWNKTTYELPALLAGSCLQSQRRYQGSHSEVFDERNGMEAAKLNMRPTMTCSFHFAFRTSTYDCWLLDW